LKLKSHFAVIPFDASSIAADKFLDHDEQAVRFITLANKRVVVNLK